MTKVSVVLQLESECWFDHIAEMLGAYYDLGEMLPYKKGSHIWEYKLTQRKVTELPIEAQIIVKAREYKRFVNQASERIYEYRNGQCPEKDCWPLIRKRDTAKFELLNLIDKL